MTVQQLAEKGSFRMVNAGEHMDQLISKPFCCDLLSIAMGKTPAGAAWITVMGNVNTLAVTTLTDAACVILAEGSMLDQVATEKAKQEGITVFSTELPIFEAALWIHQFLNE